MVRQKNIQGIVMVVLIVLLILAIGYIGVSKYIAWNQSTQLGVFQEGAQYAVMTIAQQAATCQQIPLTVGNQTINIVAIECPEIQQLLQQAQ